MEHAPENVSTSGISFKGESFATSSHNQSYLSAINVLYFEIEPATIMINTSTTHCLLLCSSQHSGIYKAVTRVPVLTH
eukprot:2372217-Pleurochrysis_carterae.AAC.1